MQGNDGNLLITAFPTFLRNLMQKKKYSGVATISVNPARHTSSWVNASERRIKIVTAVSAKLICKRPNKSVSHLNVRKVGHM